MTHEVDYTSQKSTLCSSGLILKEVFVWFIKKFLLYIYKIK